MNNRRKLIVGLGAITLVTPLIGDGARAQQTKVVRLGYLSNLKGRAPSSEAFLKGLQEFGYVEGRNLAIEWRFAAGQLDRLPSFAAELARLKVDVLVTTGIAAAQAAKQASGTIPIVMTNASDDPVRRGLVASLARPGGNVTGFIDVADELAGKRLDLFKQLMPKATRIGVLWYPDSPSATRQARGVQAAARSLGLEVQTFEVWQAEDIETALQAAVKWRADGLVVVLFGGLFGNHQSRVLELVAKAGIPAMYTSIDWVNAGGLIGYATDTVDQHRRAANYVVRILKGANPADLPIEQPTKFEVAVNIKTAKALGLTIPPTIMVQATRVIQ